MDTGAGLGVEQPHLVSAPTRCWKPWIESNTLQCHLHIASYRPLEARLGLYPYGTLYSPGSHLLIHACDTREPLLVGAPNMQRDYHDITWSLGVSVEGTETYQLWEQDTSAGAAGGRGRGRGRV